MPESMAGQSQDGKQWDGARSPSASAPKRPLLPLYAGTSALAGIGEQGSQPIERSERPTGQEWAVHYFCTVWYSGFFLKSLHFDITFLTWNIVPSVKYRLEGV